MEKNTPLRFDWPEMLTSLWLLVSGLIGFTTGGGLKDSLGSHLPVKDIISPLFYLNLYFLFPTFLLILLLRKKITHYHFNRLLSCGAIAWISLFLWGFWVDPWLHHKIHYLLNK